MNKEKEQVKKRKTTANTSTKYKHKISKNRHWRNEIFPVF